MGLRDVTAEDLADAVPSLRRIGLRRIEYADDGSISALELEPRSRGELSDTEPCPPPPLTLRRPEIPPSPPVPSESGVMLAGRDTDPHPELVPDDEPVSDKIGREIRHLLGTGRGE